MHAFNVNRRTLLLGTALAGFAGHGIATAQGVRKIDVWKDPDCGCCKDWVSHLEKNGFKVTVHEAGKNAKRAELGLAEKFASCHTGVIEGYAIEGHVPASDIQRLLREKPQAVGLAVPGMVTGSPGMDGPQYGGRKDPYDVLLVKRDGSFQVFKRYA
jgi:hypothetical protein